jgi:hypothetical protein
MKSGRTIVITGAAAREFGSEGITVSVVTPGVTITPSAKKTLPQEVQDTAINMRCLHREEHTGDLAGAVFFLASPDAEFIPARPSSSMAATKCFEPKDFPMTDLFSPLRIGTLDLPNRILKSAMTCTRTTDDNVPTEVNGRLFRAACRRRTDRHRLHRCLGTGQGRDSRAGHLARRSNCGLAQSSSPRASCVRAAHDMGALPALIWSADHPHEVSGLLHISARMRSYWTARVATPIRS